MNASVTIPFDNSYIHVAETLYSKQLPTPVAKPGLIRLNNELAEFLRIDPAQLSTPAGVDILAGNILPEGAEPIATVYAGHQFGGWNPQLGDGRAILLGEVVGIDGCRYDIQLKGGGKTPYSRGGDGRSPLGPVLREYIVSEAMAAMGIPTTRSLAAVTTGEKVLRDRILPGAILTRVAKSHIRIGTFQFFASRQDIDSLTLLSDHVIARHYPEIRQTENPYPDLLHAICNRQAKLIALWQSIGFIHGVMNTDNMLVSGETIDYGPCAFMDVYQPKAVYSSIDQAGRYAYCNQPGIAQWNLSCLAQALLPLLSESEDTAVEIAKTALENFAAVYTREQAIVLHRKIGLLNVSNESEKLVDDLLDLMAREQLDFTLIFRALADTLTPDAEGSLHAEGLLHAEGSQSVSAIYPLPATLDNWIKDWKNMLISQQSYNAAQAQMYATNPVFIPRNHQVEKVIAAATDQDDFQPFQQLVDLLAKPYDFIQNAGDFALPPTPDQLVTRTFCGT